MKNCLQKISNPQRRAFGVPILHALSASAIQHLNIAGLIRLELFGQRPVARPILRARQHDLSISLYSVSGEGESFFAGFALR